MVVTAFFFEFEKHLNLCIIVFKDWDFISVVNCLIGLNMALNFHAWNLKGKNIQSKFFGSFKFLIQTRGRKKITNRPLDPGSLIIIVYLK